jgi:ubiquinone/menaquinone biosynthesis C-methylase UbiE
MNWNVLEFQRTMFERLDLQVDRSDRVLDAGCGDGSYALWFTERGASAVGIDKANHADWSRLTRPGLRFQQADAQRLPFDDGSFTLTFIKDVLHHADDPHQVLLELRRVTAPGGQVCIVECNRYNPLCYVHMTLMLDHQHFRRPVFERLVRGVFPQARFLRWESHVYPIHSPLLVGATHAIERAIAATPLLRRLASHSAAIARV